MIARLALKDILHDWLLSTCLVLAIASIIAPLLILFGLKFGTIQTLRNRLVDDPRNREIRPVSTRSFSRDWFAEIKQRLPEVSFIVPMTRQISTSITAKTASGTQERLSLMATAPGDPLLLDNNVSIPESVSCVLTEPAAQALAVVLDDKITFSVKRIRQGKTETGEFTVQVSGILDSRGSSLKTAFVPLKVIEAVEDFKDGRAVSAYGWDGKLPTAYPVFEGAAVFTPKPLSKLESVLLANNTGFTGVQMLSRDEAATKLGFNPTPEWSVYLATVKKQTVTEDSILAIRNKLRGKGAVVFPWVKPFTVAIAPAAADPVSAKIYAVTGQVHRVNTPGNLLRIDADTRRVVSLPVDILPDIDKAVLTVSGENKKLSVPIKVVHRDDSLPVMYAPATFVGQLNLARRRDIKYDKKTDTLLLSRRGYAGFRMYASTIDAVENISRQLENEGIPVHTQKERIGDVRRLDQYMTLIFWLIAAVGVIGGISALTASLYASVERKKKELNILRLLGLLKREIILFPVFQGLLLSSGGLILAGTVFGLVAGVINHLFRSHLQATESLCTLSAKHFLILTAGIFLLSILSAVFAALQATRLDPAEALRDE